jgi:hypothetical protein
MRDQKEDGMTLGESTRNSRVLSDLAATRAIVVAAHGYAERAIEREGWERRGVLGRLVRTAAPTDGSPATEAATRRAA